MAVLPVLHNQINNNNLSIADCTQTGCANYFITVNKTYFLMKIAELLTRIIKSRLEISAFIGLGKPLFGDLVKSDREI